MFPEIGHEILGYAFPNDVHILWGLMIVLYPFITGLVAGSFVVSALYHVFDKQEFKPVGRFSLVLSFCFLSFATLPLLNHLGHPERAFNIMTTPNLQSAMAGFGFFYSTYFLIVILEMWFVFRPDIIKIAAQSRGLKRLLFALLALGTYNTSERALQYDRKIIKVLAALGIPAACILHGYVGFLFGALKSNPWWSTPLMPIIFIFSAMVSGIALMIVLYMIVMPLKGLKVDRDCMAGMSRWLWMFLLLTFTLELLEIVTLAYERGEEWLVIKPLLTSHLTFSYFVLQIGVGAALPIVLLGLVIGMGKQMTAKLQSTIIT
ncbi:MAG: polysulfide reductase NrfD, partial [Chitinivibrionales bacterium]|nr:polysulfide reductase NrfD [Chitinivibrionales bacterium]